MPKKYKVRGSIHVTLRMPFDSVVHSNDRYPVGDNSYERHPWGWYYWKCVHYSVWDARAEWPKAARQQRKKLRAGAYRRV